MNRIAKQMRDILEGQTRLSENGELMHYGKSKMDGAPGRGSGRYPLGSGEDPNQHRGDLISRVQELRRQGMSEKDIAEAVGYSSTTQLRTAYSNAVNERRATQISSARAMLADGKTQAQVARELGINESTLRSLLNERSEARTNAAKETADFLRAQIEAKGMIDVGTGVELELGVSREKLNQALATLEAEGYVVYGGGVPQVTNPGKQTNIKVICPPGTEHKEIYDFENVHTVTDYKMRVDEDGSEHFDKGFEYPASMDSSRMMVRFRDDVAPDGHTGVEKDGTVEIRRGVDDLSLGESHYAQVRILVDGDKYIKGMAIYSDDMPDGVDVVFNTNKTRDQADKGAILDLILGLLLLFLSICLIFNPAILGFLTQITLYLAGIMLIVVSVASLINNRNSRYGFYIGIAGIILGLLYIVIGTYLSNPIILGALIGIWLVINGILKLMDR